MNDRAESFDAVYSRKDSYYGSLPSAALTGYLDRFNVACEGDCLDIGCGQGRNAIFLARRGFSVVAIDRASNALEGLAKMAKAQRVPIKTLPITLDVEPLPGSNYSLIVANTVIDHLELEAGNRLIEAIKSKLAPNAYVFISVFTEDDPGFLGLENSSETAGYVRRYFKSGELFHLFSTLNVLDCQETTFEDTSHGKPHLHGIARLFARRDAGLTMSTPDGPPLRVEA